MGGCPAACQGLCPIVLGSSRVPYRDRAVPYRAVPYRDHVVPYRDRCIMPGRRVFCGMACGAGGCGASLCVTYLVKGVALCVDRI